jgi:hypothetical protein
MGSLWDWDVSPEFVERFPIFIETGYGTGNGLEWAVSLAFEKIYSIEIWPAAVEHGRAKFAHDPRVSIIHDHSPNGIACIAEVERSPIFFWLDAHFPGADCFGEPFDKADIIPRLPLWCELDAIRSAPEGARKHTILIDDLRYFADLPWGDGYSEGVARDAIPDECRVLDFLNPFCNTHDVQIFLNHSGSALLSPRGAPRLRLVR